MSKAKSTMATHPSPVGRNAPCPCGSGKKHKRCCGAGNVPQALPWETVLMVLIGAVVLLAIVAGVLETQQVGGGESAKEKFPVWSESHGHWHDAEGKRADPP